jgi:hypothetical protein
MTTLKNENGINLKFNGFKLYFVSNGDQCLKSFDDQAKAERYYKKAVGFTKPKA